MIILSIIAIIFTIFLVSFICFHLFMRDEPLSMRIAYAIFVMGIFCMIAPRFVVNAGCALAGEQVVDGGRNCIKKELSK